MKDRVLIIGIIVVVFFTGISFVSCDNPTTAEEAKAFLIGTWHGTKDDGSTFTMYFSNMDTFSLSGLDKSVVPTASINMSGTYRVDTAYIYLKPTGSTTEIMILYSKINNTTFTTTKISGDYLFFNAITFHK